MNTKTDFDFFKGDTVGILRASWGRLINGAQVRDGCVQNSTFKDGVQTDGG